MSDTKDEKRRNEILSGVIPFVSPNTKDGIFDCYMQRPDGFTQWIEFNDDAFMDTLSSCLDANIDGNTVYVRKYKNGKGEIIKLERPIIINPDHVAAYIKKQKNDGKMLIKDDEYNITAGKSYFLIHYAFPNKEIQREVYFKLLLKTIDVETAYDCLFEQINGKIKNENEFSINYYMDKNNDNIDSEIPIIISRQLVKNHIKAPQ